MTTTKRMPLFLRELREKELRRKYEKVQDNEVGRLYLGKSDKSEQYQLINPSSYDSMRLDRYRDIVPWTYNRVQLKGVEGDSDYINASEIKLARPDGTVRTYIASQGPKGATTAHFWRMVWQRTTEIGVIVMLTKIFEFGREKCACYWPEQGEKTFTDRGMGITVKNASVTYDKDAETIIRTFELSEASDPGQRKTIYHLQYEGWADHAVPPKGESLLKLLSLGSKVGRNSTSPLLVHCSAGVGRTGTYITLDHLISILPLIDANNREDPIFETVDLLRKQRIAMVQTFDQYAYIYETTRQHLLHTQPSDR